MRKEVLVVFILLFAGLVYAGAGNKKCGEEDVMFRLTDETNAHVSLYSDTNSKVKFCYSDFFGGVLGGSGLHSCNEKNVLFYLAQKNNSHVSIAKDPTYNIPVCYADLHCHRRTECNKKEVEILDLMNDKNSHASAPNREESYKTKICCSSEKSKNFVGWKDEYGTSVHEARVGKTVYAFYPGYNGGDDTFDIVEKSGGGNRVIFKDVKGENMEINGVEGFGWEWTIKLSDFIGKTDDYGNFVFKINGEEGSGMRIGFCGDNIRQANYESCDEGEGNGVVCVPRGGNRYCQYCNKTCGYSSKGAFCGDSIVENKSNGYPGFDENCDWGEKNSKSCVPNKGENKCEYCDADFCKLYTLDYQEKLFWSDLIGNRIANALAETSILMNFNTSGTNVGTCSSSKKFSIYDKDDGGDTSIKEDIQSKKCEKGVYSAQWDIPTIKELAQKTTGNGEDFSDLKDFVFKVDGKESSKLEINYARINPRIKIKKLSLRCGEVIKKGTTKHVSFEIEGPQSAKVEVRVNGVKENNLAKKRQVYSFEHKFDKVGSQPIVIYVSDINRKRSLSYFVNVLVYDEKNGNGNEKYAAACIKEPNIFMGQDNHLGYVLFDASESKAINGTGKEIDKSKLEFSWEFSDGIRYTESGDKQEAYLFHKYYDVSGDNWAKLSVKVK